MRRTSTGSETAAGSELLHTLERFGEKLGLERIQFLLEKLGRPQDAVPAVHVAGTNGKGSTGAMIAAMLHAAGLRVGLFTSPHLIRYNERIVVDGEPIDDASLAQRLEELAPHIKEAAEASIVGQPTEFEVATAVALSHFAAEGVDVAVVEVGLGGRLDSTNVVRPVVTVLTPVGLDHTRVLGDTLPEIAADKAGIVRPGVPVIMAKQPDEAALVIRERAQAAGAELYEAGVDFDGRLAELDEAGTTFDVRRIGGTELPKVWVPLIGVHQVDNGAVAVAAADIAWQRLSDVGAQGRLVSGPAAPGPAASEEAIRTGMKKVQWPGRFEIIDNHPLTIVDGAHNAESADALAATVQAVLPGRRIVFVLGVLDEKPVEPIFASLLPLAAAVVFTKPSEGRTAPADPERLAQAARRVGYSGPIEIEPHPAQAVGRAKALADGDDVIIIGGSLYLIGEVKTAAAGN